MAGAEQRDSEAKPFFERGSFKAAVAVIGLLGGIWALLGAPKPWEVAGELAANPLPLRNTEIILDASSRMGASFGKATKLAIAAKGVDRYAAASENIGLALRRVGGDCEESSEPAVGFDNGHGDDVAAAAAEMEPSGKSNLKTAVQSAVNDFAGEAFHRPGSENQIVIFAGGGDQCEAFAGREIRSQLEQADIHPEFHIYAIKVSKKELKGLKAMKQQLKAVAPVQLDQADNVRQLYRAVQEDAKQTGAPSHPTAQPGKEGHPEQAEHPQAKAKEEAPPVSAEEPVPVLHSFRNEPAATDEEQAGAEEKEAAEAKQKEEEAQQKEREEAQKQEELEREEQEAVKEHDLGTAEEAVPEETTVP